MLFPSRIITAKKIEIAISSTQQAQYRLIQQNIPTGTAVLDIIKDNRQLSRVSLTNCPLWIENGRDLQ